VSLSPELQAQILRLYHAEKWLPNTIARQLGVHHSAVTRVLAQAGVPAAVASPRASVVDPYVGLITETLARFPTLSAARLYVMARERGYRGSDSQFRYRVSLLRPRKPAEAYLHLRTLPGEQAQVDWGHFGHLQVGRARRPLMAFVMVLSYSRALWVRFFLDARGASFLAGHVSAFEHFASVPRVLLYDNLKSAVLERSGDAIRFNPALLALAAHYRFEPRPVAVARGN
jgi:transposase